MSQIGELANDYYKEIFGKEPKITGYIKDKISELKDADLDDEAKIIVAFRIVENSLGSEDQKYSNNFKIFIENAELIYSQTKTHKEQIALNSYLNAHNLLLNLPAEIRLKILSDSSLTPKDLGFFAQGSRQAESYTVFLRLLNTAVYAIPESFHQADETRLAAIALLKKYPGLLFETGEITDHVDREIQASPYRLFLGAGDVWAIKQIHEEIIAKIADPEARAKAEEQAKAEFHEQFPNYKKYNKEVYKDTWPPPANMPEEALYDERNRTQIQQVIGRLKVIVQAITADPCSNGQTTNEDTTAAVAKLCEIFAPQKGKVIRTGLHFPLGIMKEIYQVFNDQFGPWSYEQLAFFSRTVIGEAEAALSAVGGQCVKNGLSIFDMAKGPDRRDGLCCPHPKGIPQELAPLDGKLGKKMFVDPRDGGSVVISSRAGYFGCYNKIGDAKLVRSLGVFAWVARGTWLAGSENLWRKKAALFGSCYAAVQREVNRPSR